MVVCVTESSSAFITFYDEDTKMLYIGSKGGLTVSFVEISDVPPYLNFGNIASWLYRIRLCVYRFP